MRTTSTIPIGKESEASLFVDILDPPALAIRREGGGLVRVEAGELRHLVEALIRAGGNVAAWEAAKQDAGATLVFPVQCTSCGRPMFVAVRGPDYYCEECEAAAGEDESTHRYDCANCQDDPEASL